MYISNIVFGGANIMELASQARGHGRLVTKTLFYGNFNPNDLSILGVYTKEN